MLEEYTHQLNERMEKSLDALRKAFNRIRELYKKALFFGCSFMVVAGIILFFGAEFFKFIGLTGEIGALIMGVCLSSYKYADKLAEKIWGLREMLLLAFFISIGMELKIDINVLKNAFFLLSLLVSFLSRFLQYS